jgi:hypothetical protein
MLNVTTFTIDGKIIYDIFYSINNYINLLFCKKFGDPNETWVPTTLCCHDKKWVIFFNDCIIDGIGRDGSKIPLNSNFKNIFGTVVLVCDRPISLIESKEEIEETIAGKYKFIDDMKVVYNGKLSFKFSTSSDLCTKIMKIFYEQLLENKIKKNNIKQNHKIRVK